MDLSVEDLKQLWAEGHYTLKGYLYLLLLAHRPTGEPWKIESVSEFCQRWNLTERQFYKAKAALVAEDAINETIHDGLELSLIRPDDSEPEPAMPALGELIADTLDAQEPETGSSDWATWYDEARRRGLVLASQRQGDTTLVCLVDERWVPFEELRSQSWEQLEAQLQPVKADDSVADELTPEQQSILAAMTRLTGG